MFVLLNTIRFGVVAAPTIDDLYKLTYISDPRLSPDGGLVAFIQTEIDRDADRYSSTIALCSVADGETRKFTQGPQDGGPRWSPDGRHLGFLRKTDQDLGPQVWVISLDGGEPRQLTRAPIGVTEFEWAPDGQRIAFTAPCRVTEDESGANPLEAPVVIEELPYKFDGVGLTRGFKARLFVIDVDGAEAKQLTEGNFSVTNPAWSPEGTEIAFISAMHADRGLDLAMHLFVLTLEDGKRRQLTYGNTLATTPVWTSTGDRIVFAGKRESSVDTLMLVFTVEAGGGEPVDLMPDFDRNVLAGLYGWPGAHLDLVGDEVFFSAQDGSRAHVFKVPIEGGSPEKVVGGDDRAVMGLSAGRSVAFIVSSYDVPGDVFTSALDGGVERRLTELNAGVLGDIELVPYERRTFTAPDGTEIEGWLIDAGGDDPRPLLLDVHGGPHAAWGPFFLHMDLHSQLLAARGWSVLLLNPRGSDGYGEAFTRALRRGWGINDYDDFMSAVDAFVEEGIADPGRLAVTGYSYGGYMTNWLVTHTDRFAAAIAGGSVSDLAGFFGTADIGAWFMGTEMQADPHEDPDLYRRASPIAHVSNVTTPILLLHGQSDDRCPVSQSEQFFVALNRQRKTAQLVIYPGGGHGFRLLGKPSQRFDYTRRLIGWLATHVKDSADLGDLTN